MRDAVTPARGGHGWGVLAALALVYAGVELVSSHAIAWDEVEFFRATQWIAQGQVPYRDFWEHHSPLQWLLFAPVAKVLGGGTGTGVILAMRFAQIPLWIALFAYLNAMARRAGAGAVARSCAFALLLLTPAFVRAAVEYRLDVAGNHGFVAGLGFIIRGWEQKGKVLPWCLAGLCLSLAVLANMRLAMMVVLVAALAFFCDPEERRWKINARALFMTLGVVPVAAAFIGWLFAAGAWAGFVDGVFRYNTVSDRLVEGLAAPFSTQLFAPLLAKDVSAIALWAAAIAATVIVLRTIRRPGLEHVLAILFVASVASIAVLGVYYPYHFQIAYLFIAVMAALFLERMFGDERRAPVARLVAIAVAIAALLLDLAFIVRPASHATMRHQDVVMKEVDRRTKPGDVVWDGVGYALRRKPAYRYWFLPAGVRLMAKEGLLEPYDLPQLRANPPAAIVYNHRIHLWLLAFPRLQRDVVHHYLPLYRNLWIPGMSGVVQRGTRLQWRAVAEGEYELWSSELLTRHPWLERPLDYAIMNGPDSAAMEIPLERLPPLATGALQWRVDGQPLPPGARVVHLKQGSVLEVVSASAERAGVLAVPRGVKTLCRTPQERIFF